MNTNKLKELVNEHHARTFSRAEEEEIKRQNRIAEARRTCWERWKKLFSEEFREALEEAGFTCMPKAEEEIFVYISVKRHGDFNEMKIAPSFEEQKVNWFREYPWGVPSFTYDLSSRDGELKLAAEIAFQFKVN